MIYEGELPGSGGGVSWTLGIAALLFGATAAFAQLQSALNTVWAGSGPG